MGNPPRREEYPETAAKKTPEQKLSQSVFAGVSIATVTVPWGSERIA
jgi:hypothetical protein